MWLPDRTYCQWDSLRPTAADSEGSVVVPIPDTSRRLASYRPGLVVQFTLE